MIKVLHLISGGDSGGAKTHVFSLLEEQCSIADVTVACLIKGVFWNEMQDMDVRSVMFEQKHRFDMSVCADMVRFIREEGFDIINAHGARANFVVSFIKKRINIPIVTTVHSDYLLDFDTPVKKLMFGGLNRAALRHIDYRIGVSEAFREMLIERGFEPNTTYAVYNGMNFEAPLPEVAPRAELARKYGVPYDESAVYIGIAARFDYVKGVDVFIDAAAKVLASGENVHFIIAGEGALEAELKARAASLGIAERVHFIGFVSPIWEYLALVDVNMLTSRCESFPYALLEGAKVHKPTVASAVGGIPDLIKSGKTGLLFKSESTDACAGRILEFVRDESFRRDCGDALYEKASTEYSNRALAAAYVENYAHIIAQYKRKKKYDIILSGYYGFDNYGDELILQTLVSALKQARPEIQLLVLSHSPEQTKLKYKVDSVGRFAPFAISRSMRKSRMYVNGGGTLLTDVTSRRSLGYYITLLRAARMHHLKTMLLANGIGPFKSRASERRAIRALGKVDLITLRDKGTLSRLENDIDSEKMKLTADIAMISALVSDGEDNDAGKRDDHFLVSVRDWAGNAPDLEVNIAESCKSICREYSLKAVFLPMQDSQDTAISRRIAEMTGSDAEVCMDAEGLAERASLISNARFVLAMRLHPLICAAMNSVPAIALSYDEKVTNFMLEQQAGAVFGADCVSREELISAMKKAAEEQIPQKYFEKKKELLIKRSFENIDLCLELLDSMDK